MQYIRMYDQQVNVSHVHIQLLERSIFFGSHCGCWYMHIYIAATIFLCLGYIWYMKIIIKNLMHQG